jgi:urease accessory protein
MPADAGALTYALGFVAATALLHAAGIAASMGVAAMTGRYGRTIAQVAGGLFALGGVGVLAGWL